MVGWMGGARGAVWTQHRCGVTCWSPSIFLTFTFPHTLSQGPTEDLHPVRGYPAWLEEIRLSSAPQPPHSNSSLQTQLQPSWVRKRLFLAGDKQKIAWLVPEQSWDLTVCRNRGLGAPLGCPGLVVPLMKPLAEFAGPSPPVLPACLCSSAASPALPHPTPAVLRPSVTPNPRTTPAVCPQHRCPLASATLQSTDPGILPPFGDHGGTGGTAGSLGCICGVLPKTGLPDLPGGKEMPVPLGSGKRGGPASRGSVPAPRVVLRQGDKDFPWACIPLPIHPSPTQGFPHPRADQNPPSCSSEVAPRNMK